MARARRCPRTGAVELLDADLELELFSRVTVQPRRATLVHGSSQAPRGPLDWTGDDEDDQDELYDLEVR